MKSLSFHPKIGTYDLTDPQFLTFVIENKSFYWRFCDYLYNGFPEHIGYCSLDVDGKGMPIDDVSLFVANPWDLDINSKSNLNALYKLLKKSYFHELEDAVNQIQKELTKICQEIKLDFDADLSMQDSIRVDDVFKLGGLQFAEGEGSFLERLTRYVTISRELRGVCLVFVNHIRDFLSEEELESFLKELHYRGVSLVSIETSTPIHKFSDEKVLIVDSDLCPLS